jgi:hypothetical protein
LRKVFPQADQGGKFTVFNNWRQQSSTHRRSPL